MARKRRKKQQAVDEARTSEEESAAENEAPQERAGQPENQAPQGMPAEDEAPKEKARPVTEGEQPQPAGEGEAPQEEQEPAQGGGKVPCPVVGVGASAGGLEALQSLFGHLPRDLKVAFVVIQHRASDPTSVMQSLLEKKTYYQVQDIREGMAIRPQVIYLAPADKDVSITDGTLYISDPPPHTGVRLPIDAFLRSLAQDGAEKAICIILSGTGSDGTLGLKEVVAAGGMAMAQDPQQAKYDNMPHSAIDTDMVDFVLPVEKMGEQLAQYIRHPLLKQLKPSEAGDTEKERENQLGRVCALIRSQTGHDFAHYKRTTIRRRVARRLAVHQIEDLGHYIKLLQENPEEVRILSREMLITVTNFFRDPEAFDALRDRVLRPLVDKKAGDDSIRIWVAGCATGEEPYSIAILLQEQMNEMQRHVPVQIFATDLDEESIDVGRKGQYAKNIAADVAPSRLKQSFINEDNHYKVKNSIREMVVFAKHNLIKDPPFSKLDLITCRNVLIYMDNTLQRKLIPLFHYTLNAGGHLFLGESESIGTFSDLFVPVDSKHKVFRRKPVQAAVETERAAVFYHLPRPDREEERARPTPAHADPAKVAERVILRDYSLPCVLVDEDYNVVYFSGDTSPYLSQPGGKPTFSINQMARPEIHYKLNLLLKRAFHEKQMAAEQGIQIRANGHYQDVDIEVRPMNEQGLGTALALVVFKARPKNRKAPAGTEVPPVELPEEEKDARIRELEQELQSTKEYLQTTIEELETSNEELKSSNEELQSTNEELQSTNEELDTSREELQSTNEELRTVNSEHQQKIEELSRAYDDLNNLLGATEVATLFLDNDLKIRRFTPTARSLFRLMDRDVGRPLHDIASSIENENFTGDIHTVLEKLARIDKEIQGKGGAWYHMKIIPYRTSENVIEGTVVTFVDITRQKQTALRAEQTAEFVEAIVETVRQPLLVLDGELRVTMANPAFYRHFHAAPEQTLGMLIYELGNRQWDIPELRRLLEQIVPENEKFEDFRVQHEFPQIGRRAMLLNARQTTYKGEATGRILLAFEDVTDRPQASPG